jgi:3D (Asp-Asp-Asp) domain-containing protein
MKSKIAGSAVGLLLFFSAISYSRTFIQDPKPVPQTTRQAETSNPQADTQPISNNTSAESKLPGGRAAEPSASAASLSAATEKAISSDGPSPSNEVIAAPPQAYMATAYSLRGRTSSGRPASRGLIAADPSVLPLGTRVRLEAGSFSGEYVVGDTGGSVRGRRIDIWTPTANEALRFGRRVVKLTVLSFGGKRAKSTLVHPRPTISSTTTQSANQREK